MLGRKKETAEQLGDPRVAAAREGRRRMLVVKVALLLFFVVVALRLVQIQAVDAPRYKEIARRQYEEKVTLPATRGNIYDRNGVLLVSNSMYVSFAADPKMIGSKAEAIANRFARTFDRPRGAYLNKLGMDDRHFVWLERRVRPQYSRQIRVGDFEGLIELAEPKRLYHYERLAGQVIGFTDVDNNGLSGIELQLNEQLHGVNGYVVMQRDGLGRTRPSVDYPRIEPVNGLNAALTLDAEYQAIAEQELARGIERTQAESGLVVMLDPATGEVLAMANNPMINPSDAAGVPAGLLKNRAITDMFEPGSVFKLVTASAALEHGLVKPEQKFFAEHGKYVVHLPGGRTREITDTHEYGMLSFQEAMVLSSNIVMAKVSNEIGAERFYTMARNFGFGTESGVDLPGEVSGELKKPTEWSGTTLNTMAYGYEVGVTPIQIAAAYAAVANKGVLMKPFIVKQILDGQYKPVGENQPQAIRRVIAKPTALQLTHFLEGVVERGTGQPAKIPGIRIAGKTGTSRKFVDGKYELGNYTASFVGFFPADDPRVVCLVMLDHPKAGGYTGGQASAPIFKEIAQKIYATSGRFTRRSLVAVAGPQQYVVPDVTSLQFDVAKSILVSQGFDAEVEGEGAIVVEQSPAAGTKSSRGAKVSLRTTAGEAAAPQGFAVVPDLIGLSARRAVNRLAARQLDVEINGSGVVTAQSPHAGEQVKTGTRITVHCEPRALPVLSMN